MKTWTITLISVLVSFIGGLLTSYFTFLGGKHSDKAEINKATIENAPNFWERIDKLENERDEARKSLNSLQAKMNIITSINQELVRQNDSLKKQSDQIMEENKNLRKKVDKLTELTERLLQKEGNK